MIQSFDTFTFFVLSPLFYRSMSEAKDRIIEAAGPIFAQKGFAATTVREICSAAKVNQAAINYYFGSKESLYKEVFTATYSSFSPWIQGESDLAVDRSRSFEERLRYMIVRRTKEIFATELSRWKVQLMFREIHDPTPCCGDRLQEHIVQDYVVLYEYLDEYFDPNLSEDLRWKYVLNMFGSIIHYRTSRWLIRKIIPETMREEHFKAEQVGTLIVDSFLQATAHCRRKN